MHAENFENTPTYSDTVIRPSITKRKEPNMSISTNCNMCGNACTDGTIYCDAGLHWIHYVCAGLSSKQIEFLENPQNTNIRYECPPCGDIQDIQESQQQQVINMPCEIGEPPILIEADTDIKSSTPILIEADTEIKSRIQTIPTITLQASNEERNKNDDTERIEIQMAEREKALRVKERKLQTREKLLKEQETELTDLSKKLTCSRSYIHQLEDEVKAAKEENRFLMLRLAALSGGNSTGVPQPTQNTSKQDMPSEDNNNNFYKLENQMLQLRLDQSNKHSQLQDYLMKQSYVMMLILQKLENQVPLQERKSNQHQPGNNTNRKSRRSRPDFEHKSTTNVYNKKHAETPYSHAAMYRENYESNRDGHHDKINTHPTPDETEDDVMHVFTRHHQEASTQELQAQPVPDEESHTANRRYIPEMLLQRSKDMQPNLHMQKNDSNSRSPREVRSQAESNLSSQEPQAQPVPNENSLATNRQYIPEMLHQRAKVIDSNLHMQKNDPNPRSPREVKSQAESNLSPVESDNKPHHDTTNSHNSRNDNTQCFLEKGHQRRNST